MIHELILILFMFYLSIVWIFLYTSLTGYEFVFKKIFGINQGLTYLCFLGIGIGILIASCLVPWRYKRYLRSETAIRRKGELGLPPEERLLFAMICAPMLPIGLFWMAWTAFPALTVWPCLAATIPIGFSMIGIFVSTYQYLIDVYEIHSGSALVGCTFVRFLAAGCFVEVSLPMYNSLGVHWTLTLLASVSVLVAPLPFIFSRYGPRIRKHSKYVSKDAFEQS
jgi:hypothetical protein